ncbi:MAG: transposase [Pseudomonadota bacterium]|nr:transposase [Pseudomonadota bacterium]
MDYRRAKIPGTTYFFTLVTEHRRPLLIEHIDRLRAAFRHVREKRPFRMEAIVVLPDHLHTLWTLPEGDSDYSTRWMQIKRKFSSSLSAAPSNPSQASKREKGIWQRRFWEHCIRDELDWRNHLDYIHYNPVKHGLITRVYDWPYSSFHRFVERGWYSEDWGDEVSVEVRNMEHE